ncbi:MAG: EamA family transporter [Ignavibacterium sp.]|nr:EamA family transporter [Ignavibacterium sp.]MCX7611479.1 EamA family transporter [Ignavibacterium sp.]MDW8374549.1 EamA family transporter [Ignavibacteriales bacterium]
MRETATYKIVIIYLILCFVWGSTWLAIKMSLESFPPFLSAGIRFVIASFTIYFLMNIRGTELQTDKEALKLYFMLGFFSFVIPFGLVYWAEQFVDSGLASVLFAVYPFFVAIFSYFLIPNEEIGIVRIVGMILGFSGIVVIFHDSFSLTISDYILGMFAIVLSAIMQAFMAVTIKKRGKYLNPLTMNLIPMLIAGFIMMLIGLFYEGWDKVRLTEKGIIAVIYLAVIGSVVTFTSFYWLLKKVSVIIMSFIAFITPIVAIFLGWILYDETLSEKHTLGTALVLIGVFIANLPQNSIEKIKKMAARYF